MAIPTAKQSYAKAKAAAREGRCKAALVHYTAGVKKNMAQGHENLPGAISARKVIYGHCLRGK